MRKLVVSAFVTGILLLSSHVNATLIEVDDIFNIPSGVSGSGNGTLDIRMFTFSGAEIPNSVGSFDGDNANNDLPNNGGKDTLSFAESYVTTAGELKAYYDLNFGVGNINQIMLLLDFNETNGDNNTLEKLDIVVNPTSIGGSPDPSGDVLGDTQAAIDQVYTGGTTIASLSADATNINLPTNSQGAGIGDYAIFTGINPFDLNDSDVLLFNISMSQLSNGAEELYLSGDYSPGDISPSQAVPEPATLFLLGIGSLLLRPRKIRQQQYGLSEEA